MSQLGFCSTITSPYSTSVEFCYGTQCKMHVELCYWVLSCNYVLLNYWTTTYWTSILNDLHWDVCWLLCVLLFTVIHSKRLYVWNTSLRKCYPPSSLLTTDITPTASLGQRKHNTYLVTVWHFEDEVHETEYLAEGKPASHPEPKERAIKGAVVSTRNEYSNKDPGPLPGPRF